MNDFNYLNGAKFDYFGSTILISRRKDKKKLENKPTFYGIYFPSREGFSSIYLESGESGIFEDKETKKAFRLDLNTLHYKEVERKLYEETKINFKNIETSLGLRAEQ